MPEKPSLPDKRPLCERCGGEGSLFDRDGKGGRDYPVEYDWYECPRCEGTGIEPDEEDAPSE